MKTIDWTKANAWIDSYLKNLSDGSILPTKLNRTWIEFEAERVGLVKSGWDWEFMESHAAWYAALIRTKRLREVNSAEKRVFKNRANGTLSTVNKLLRGRMRDTHAANLLRNMLII